MRRRNVHFMKIVRSVLAFAFASFFFTVFFAGIACAQGNSGSIQPERWNNSLAETSQAPTYLKPAQDAPTTSPLDIPKPSATQEVLVSRVENTPETTEKTGNKSKIESGLNLEALTAPGGIQNSLVVFLTLSAVSVAPAFVMMTTSFLRIFVVLCILRHGFGTQGIPGTQVLAALALFMTFFLMFPTWQRTWSEAVVPYREGTLTAETAVKSGLRPLREFMSAQLENTGNTEEILLFWRYSSTPPDETRLAQYTAEDVPTHVLLPAFMLSELKTAFLMGVQLLIPLLVIDLLVSAILVSMGMFMLPPTVVSLPLKLLLFVLADGWRLVVEMMLVSFG